MHPDPRAARDPDSISHELVAPLASMRLLREEMARMFADDPGDRFASREGEIDREARSPTNLGVEESETHLLVRTEIAGVDSADVDVNLSRPSLSIPGRKQASADRQAASLPHAGRRGGSSWCVVEGPKWIDRDRIKDEHGCKVVTISP